MSAIEIQALLESVENLRKQVMSVVEQLPEESWQSPTPGEDWPVGFAVRHHGTGVNYTSGWIGQVLAGAALELTSDDLNRANAEALSKYEALPKAVELNRLNGTFTQLTEHLANLRPEQLQLSVPMVALGKAVNIPFLVNVLLPRHTQAHLESLQQILTA